MYSRTGSNRTARRRHRVSVIALLAAISIFWVGASPAKADGSRFAVAQCRAGAPDQGATASSAFSTSGSGANYVQQNLCPNIGGYLDEYVLGGQQTGPYSGAYWSIGGVTPGGHNDGVSWSASANYPDRHGGAGWQGTWYAGSSLNGPIYGDGYWHPGSADGDVRGLVFELICLSFSNCDGGTNVSVQGITFHSVDPNPPVITSESGSLLGGSDLRGTQDLAISATDQGGGLTALSVLVNGQLAWSKGYPCATYGGEAINFSPCAASASEALQLNTEREPFHDGANDVEVCAQDYANEGLAQLACSSHVVAIDNSCAGSPVGGGQDLSLKFKQSDADTVTVDPDTLATVTGQLSNDAGQPVSGATLCVSEQKLLPGQRLAEVGTVQTDGAGRYSYTVSPGPSRVVGVGYRFNRTQINREGKYYAHARPTLRVFPNRTRNGRKITLFGSIPGPDAPGRVVILQATAGRSKSWITFGRASTDPHGDYQMKYRFRHTTRRVTYRFRAELPAQSGYAYLEGTSGVEKVKVRPKRRHRGRS